MDALWQKPSEKYAAPPAPIRILIADDHAVVRSGLRSLLHAAPDLEVVGEAVDGYEAVDLAGQLDPDLVLLDITMPPQSGIQTAKKLKEKYPEITVVFLTMHEDEGLLHEALRTGASGYVVKRAEENEILEAIHTAMRGDIYVHPAMAPERQRQPDSHSQERFDSLGESLSEREIEVLRMLVEGKTNQQIASQLGASIRTVEAQRAELMAKLGLVSRVDLMNYAEENQIC